MKNGTRSAVSAASEPPTLPQTATGSGTQAAPQAARTISIALTGSGGAGVMTAGQTLLKAAARAGLYGIMVRSLGPQIRGGEAAAFLRLGTDPVLCGGDSIDILVAFDWTSTNRFAAEIELTPESLVLRDPELGDPPAMVTDTGARCADLPLSDLAKKVPGGRPNMIALGALAGVVGLSAKALIDIVSEALAKKGEAVVKAAVEGLEAGLEVSQDLGFERKLPEPGKAAKRWNISGNEAIGLGALRAGLRFVAAYPITPATEVLEWLAPNLEHLGGELVQAEDELASINMIVGASFGGLPALTATSGPGLALMLESVGLALASETPVVIIDVQRGGPSTGIPTKSEQTDLNIALYGLHGDAPHIVTAANSVADSLFTAQWSTYLAEQLQCPAIVMTDQLLGQTRAIVDAPSAYPFAAERTLAPAGLESYERYAITESGVSPMAIPGMPGGEYVADGLEHTPTGRPSSQAEDHIAQLEKRNRKLALFDFGEHWADVVGEGETAIVTWGSSTGPALEARARAQDAGMDVRVVSMRLLLPAQVDGFHAALEGVKRVLVAEQSHSQQFYRYLRAFYDLPEDVRVFSRPGPLPMRPGEILEKLSDWS